MSDNCGLCFQPLSNANVNLLSGDIQRELNDIVKISLETPLDSDSRLCKSCLNHVEQRMDAKTKLREADQRIREIYYGGILKEIQPRPNMIRGKTLEQRKMDTFGEKYKQGTSLGCVKNEGISSFKCENGSVKSEFCKEESDSSMYKLEKELWDDEISCEATSDKENM